MGVDFNSSLLLIVIFQFLFMGLFLLTSRRGKRLSNLLLGFFCVIIGLNLIDMLLLMLKQYEIIGFLSMLDLAMILTFGPLIWFYTLSVLYKDFSLNIRSWLHFLPSVLFMVSVVSNFLSYPKEDQVQALERIHNFELTLSQALIVVPFYLHMLVYMVFSAREFGRYNKSVSERFSDLSQVNPDWMKFLFRSFLAILLVSAALSLFPYSPWQSYTGVVLITFIVLVFLVINQIVFKALRQPEIFSGISMHREKYAGSKLQEKEKTEFLEKLDLYMAEQKPYLNPDLTLDQLSENTEIKARDLSQVINEKHQTSFNDFINRYRVEHAKGIMDESSDEKLTILEILYQSGFNSKSSFNTAFKRVMSKTPTDYRRSIS